MIDETFFYRVCLAFSVIWSLSPANVFTVWVKKDGFLLDLAQLTSFKIYWFFFLPKIFDKSETKLQGLSPDSSNVKMGKSEY